MSEIALKAYARRLVSRTKGKPTAAKAETFSRYDATGSSTPTTQVLSLTAIWLPAGTKVSTITFATTATAQAGGSHAYAALFDKDRNKLAQSADDTTATWAANTAKTFTLTAPVTVSGGLYYIGLAIQATTMPSLASIVPSAALSALAPKLGGTSSTAQVATAPATAAAISDTAPFALYASVA